MNGKWSVFIMKFDRNQIEAASFERSVEKTVVRI